METVPNKSTFSSTPRDHSTPKTAVVERQGHDRRTLQTLQPAAIGGKLNGGKGGVNQVKDSVVTKPISHHEQSLATSKPASSSSQTVKIYADSTLPANSSSIHCTRLTQTDDSLLENLLHEKLKDHINDPEDSGRGSGYFDQEAYDLMVNEVPSEGYWKGLAEERRRALKETLEENKRLSLEIKGLKEENSRLSEIAAQAESLQELLQSVISDDEDADEREQDSTADQHPSLTEDPDSASKSEQLTFGKVTMQPEPSSTRNGEEK